MAFIDELKILASAGRGGDGVVRWLHVKGVDHAGPSGGNGGNGGDVYIRSVRDISLLGRYSGEKKFFAQSGNSGEGLSKHGASGEDKVIDLPVGSIVKNTNTGESYELLTEGQKIMILKGGRGGVGNKVFRSSVNQRPDQSTPGIEGESATLEIELRLIADAGLVGLPNAGKSSLLNALTKASAKVDSYAFTTLDPNLGALYGFVVADIPGLIEGASEGKGLGHKFLRHISRTKMLLHCVSLESETPLDDWRVVRKELVQYQNGAIKDLKELIVLTKSDSRDLLYINDIIAEFSRYSDSEILSATILDDDSVSFLKKIIIKRLNNQ